MSKKDFIALGDAIRWHNQALSDAPLIPAGIVARHAKQAFSVDQLETLAQFCQEQNTAFNRDRWLEYIVGTNGKNGGKVGA